VKAAAVDLLTSLYNLTPPEDFGGSEQEYVHSDEDYVQERIAELDTKTFAFARSAASAVSNSVLIIYRY
jgi:hypothetical protein